MPTVQELAFNEKDLRIRWKQVKDDFWSDIKGETVKALKRLMETTMELEINDLIGAGRFVRSRLRSRWRNGFYVRRLATSIGEIPDLEVPRVRRGQLSFKVLPRYQRRAKDVDRMVMEMFLAGVSTRRIREVIEPLMGPYALSATTVSRITKVLDSQVRQWHQRPIPDEFAYLILDGVYLKTKSPIQSKRRCILVAYGITAQGRCELIDFRMTREGESQLGWEAFLTSLRNRGLEGTLLKLAVVDGNRGLWNALDMVYPDVPRQRCWAHKLRNIANSIPRRLQKACLNQARDIYQASNRTEAMAMFRAWKRVWGGVVPKAVSSLENDLDDLLVVFHAAPRSLWKRLRTTNRIERVFREVRRRTRPMSCFENKASVERIIFAIFNRLNQIWRRKPLRLSTQFN